MIDSVINNCGGIEDITYNIEDDYYGFSLWLSNGSIAVFGFPDKTNFIENIRILKGAEKDG